MTTKSYVSTSTLAIHRSADADTRWFARAAVVLLGSSLLWASAKVQVPFWPVPMTMQTYGVLMLGGLLGWRLGAATVAAYLLEGILGLPVFAGTPANGAGLSYIAGPTGGYLAGYLAAVVLVGALTESGWNRSVFWTAAALLMGELAILTLGCCGLAVQFGWQKALGFGLGPFLVGDTLKLAAAVATLTCWKRATLRLALGDPNAVGPC